MQLPPLARASTFYIFITGSPSTYDYIRGMKQVSVILFLFFFCFGAMSLQAQEKIRVKGKVTNQQGKAIPGVMVLNQRTYSGFFASSSGDFTTEIQHNDTLSIGAFGMKSTLVSFKDSVYKPEYELEVILMPLRVDVGTAEVFAPRELKEIYRDIDRLGFEEKDYRTSGVDALSSPITFLYEQFSKRERSKRLAMELENADRRRELLKELFQKYVDYDIIELDNDDFDEFITFLNVSDEFLQSTTQYQFLLYVKDRFKEYKILKRRMKESDFNYHLDD